MSQNRMEAHPETVIYGLDETILSRLCNGYSSVFILTDDHTLKWCLPLVTLHLGNLNPSVITIPPGEENKNLQTVEFICRRLLSSGADRKSVLINLGGGMVLDTGGFAASVFMRGIDFIHIPTSLLAMTDAAVGGKTGVDMSVYKNIIGTFTEPRSVLIDHRFLRTLPEREMRNGFAEMIKHALLSGRVFLEKVLALSENMFLADEELIRENIVIKESIVRLDYKESGLRKLLNFGHTVGHAIESATIGLLKHGECVAIGMAADLYLSHKLCGFPEAEMKMISERIRKVFPDVICKIAEEEILDNIKADKKNRSGETSVYLLKEIGVPDKEYRIDREHMREAIAFAINQFS